ncbi:hypothetical protein E1264_32895 [Actinomadura sp. KC216]|uniref:hypothetical protein n=1 Tax=Actinomadura sp. KC216 TaxID=2530370 RepID=UPI001048C867|nr:hypothetical protein [Actinomadura sp. KC216]TDB81300.1 hypothetical protein E1264_32895 [Actinomadura sp. KC216]
MRPRQTLRWQINHRFTTERGWYYRLDTLNVSYGHRTAEVFLHPPNPPSRRALTPLKHLPALPRDLRALHDDPAAELTPAERRYLDHYDVP